LTWRVVRVGDIGGLGRVYTESGAVITRAGETILRILENWDMSVTSPWRRFLPKIMLDSSDGKVSSRLYVTTERIIFVRQVDAWAEMKSELTPLGIPAASSKQQRLSSIIPRGARKYCEVYPGYLRLVKSRQKRSWLGLLLLDSDNRQYRFDFWKSDDKEDLFTLIKSRFKQ
jgi:hypothetical protein